MKTACSAPRNAPPDVLGELVIQFDVVAGTRTLM
jgi:hypothetical protein